ncbi:hypothetical protein ACJJTC_003815, partial [Scirpophaga incertulas]
MKCIVFVRPTSENIALLSRELKHPKYGVYFIYLSNVISKSDVKTLADSDEQEVVREVTEVFADYLAVDRHLFSFNITGCLHGRTWQQAHLQRCAGGLAALALALRRRAVVRHCARSEPCLRLAERLAELLRREPALPDRDLPPLLVLLLDRRSDPVTPLLHQVLAHTHTHCHSPRCPTATCRRCSCCCSTAAATPSRRCCTRHSLSHTHTHTATARAARPRPAAAARAAARPPQRPRHAAAAPGTRSHTHTLPQPALPDRDLPPLLVLLLDRRSDPVTPLLHQVLAHTHTHCHSPRCPTATCRRCSCCCSTAAATPSRRCCTRHSL